MKNKIVSIICAILMLAAILMFTGCGDRGDSGSSSSTSSGTSGISGSGE
ncbi:MAG: hypothetical protein HY757_01065 [Nitrospirae bacterium]|nr:hypothetical protein [Nitrospirota bacterium]